MASRGDRSPDRSRCPSRRPGVLVFCAAWSGPRTAAQRSPHHATPHRQDRAFAPGTAHIRQTLVRSDPWPGKIYWDLASRSEREQGPRRIRGWKRLSVRLGRYDGQGLSAGRLSGRACRAGRVCPVFGSPDEPCVKDGGDRDLRDLSLSLPTQN